MLKTRQILKAGALAGLAVVVAAPVAAEMTLKASAALSTGR